MLLLLLALFLLIGGFVVLVSTAYQTLGIVMVVAGAIILAVLLWPADADAAVRLAAASWR